MINPEDVVDAVRTFMEDVSAETPLSAPATGTKSENEDRVGQKRLSSMKNFWNQLSNVVNDDTAEVWSQMENNYTNLKQLLITRSNTISYVDTLNEKNAQLKKILNQYLGDSNINNEMQVPPAQVMCVRTNNNRK